MSEEGKNIHTHTPPNKKNHTLTPPPQNHKQTKNKPKQKTPNPVNVDPASRRFNRRILSQETNCQHRAYKLVLFLAKLANCADLVLVSHTASLWFYSPESGAYWVAMKRLHSCSLRLKNLGKTLSGNSRLAAYSLIYRMANSGTCW